MRRGAVILSLGQALRRPQQHREVDQSRLFTFHSQRSLKRRRHRHIVAPSRTVPLPASERLWALDRAITGVIRGMPLQHQPPSHRHSSRRRRNRTSPSRELKERTTFLGSVTCGLRIYIMALSRVGSLRNSQAVAYWCNAMMDLSVHFDFNAV